MSSLKRLSQRFLTSGLCMLMVTVIVLGFGSANSLAATKSPTQHINQPSLQLAMMNRVEAEAKNIEGKTQEAIGNVTGNRKDEMMGKAKQAESQVRNTVEDMKGDIKNRTKAGLKNLEGKTQEAIGNVTGNRKDEMMGQAKQVEGNVRNAVEDIKDTIQDIFD
jgi:uncharacterized protein YjbJ (UPF0337 family)